MTQVIERAMPESEVSRTSDISEQNAKEADIPEKEIEPENTRKGGDAEKEKFLEIENKAARTDTAHVEKQPAQNEQPKQIR